MWTLLLCAPGGDALADGLTLVRAALLRGADERELGDEVLARRLAALGAPAAPALVALVEGTGLELLLGEGEDEADEPLLLLCPPERVGELALRALARLPDEAVLAALRALVQARPGPESRTVALRVLAVQDSARALTLAFELLAALPLELSSPTLRVHARAALRAPLGRDPVAYLRLADELADAPLHVLVLVSEALAECGTEDALDALEELLGRDPALDLTLIEALARAGETRPWRLGLDVAGVLEGLLVAGTPARRAAAASALGRLARPDSVPRLVALLEDVAPEVRLAALDAVASCAHQPAFPDRAACLTWLARESAWWSESGEPRVAALAAGEGSLSETLRELYAHPLARAAAAEALLEGLSHDDPARRALAAGALARLAAHEHVPDLVPLLDDPDPSVRQASLRALRTLTGLELPGERALWDAWAFD